MKYSRILLLEPPEPGGDNVEPKPGGDDVEPEPGGNDVEPEPGGNDVEETIEVFNISIFSVADAAASIIELLLI